MSSFELKLIFFLYYRFYLQVCFDLSFFLRFFFPNETKRRVVCEHFSSPMSLDVYATIFFPSKVKFDLLYSNADLDIFDLLCYLGEVIVHRLDIYLCILACENYSVDNILSRTLHGNIF